MPTICPNCLRPVRSGVKYCGYCGTVLQNTVSTDTRQAKAAPIEEVIDDVKPVAAEKPKPTRRQVQRMVMIILILLLCLVLAVAFTWNNWSAILALFG